MTTINPINSEPFWNCASRYFNGAPVVALGFGQFMNVRTGEVVTVERKA